MDLSLNRGFWVYISIFLIYFLLSFKRPNPDNIFAAEFKDNLKVFKNLFTFYESLPIYFFFLHPFSLAYDSFITISNQTSIYI